ncbi:DUF6011 domain-containing protein [Nonomuraea sp. NPDC050310]|uniref:DUF6011 domain-containing protein n=1 Tax=unclassified Nonomuraea TaxID=2593643 RepID=UPI0033C012F3
MSQLDLLGLPEVRAHAARCRACKRKLRDPESLGFVIGPTCRKKLGIEERRPLRLTGVRPGGDCAGQGDLLENWTPQQERPPR